MERTSPTHISASKAASRLGVSLPTLYAYVSRGLIRSEATGEKKRTRRYSLEDVERVRERKELRRNPALAVRNALHWGAPLLESSLTLITEQGLFYRGQNALDLAQGSSIEETAALLWLDDRQAGPRLFASQAAHPLIRKILGRLRPLKASATLMQRLSLAIVLAGEEDLAAYDLAPQRVTQTGALLTRLLAAAAAEANDPTLAIAPLLAKGWGGGSEAETRLLAAALILCADHELNVSAFAARVVASAQAHPYHVVAAGLAALQGLRHGGSARGAEALQREAAALGAAVEPFFIERLRSGEPVPGFGHRLYPAGDPRAARLLALTRAACSASPRLAVVDRLTAMMRESAGLEPNLDLALAALTLLLDLPPGAAPALFAIGRSVGWIGHAIEQYREGRMIRPRARYTGPVPSAAPKA